MTTPSSTGLWRDRHRLGQWLTHGLVGAALGAGVMFLASRTVFRSSAPGGSQESAHAEDHGGHEGHDEAEAGHIVFPKPQWSVAKLRIEPAKRGPLTQYKWVTGKLAINGDRTAHIYPLVEGRLHHVNVRFGQDVKEGDILAVIDSKEVGQAKLGLFQNRLATRIAEVNNDWAQEINENTQALIEALAKKPPISEIDVLFKNKQMGQYRQQLLASYARLHKSRVDLERLEPLASQGITAGKQALAAKATFDADQATFGATLEQLRFTAKQEALRAGQKLQEAQTAERVSESLLYILGYDAKELEQIDPVTEGEEVAHYLVKAPFAGTILAKDVVIDERVSPGTRMFQLTDLSTLWVQADIFEQDLPRLAQLNESLQFRTGPYDHLHEAEVFYAGDVVDPKTRTARVMATTPNPDRHLKPGMFIEVQLPGETAVAEVLQLPTSAIQRHEGETFVFVHKEGEEFERRDVQIGRAGEDVVEIRAGLKAGEPVVVSGTFGLKTKLLSSSVGASHAH